MYPTRFWKNRSGLHSGLIQDFIHYFIQDSFRTHSGLIQDFIHYFIQDSFRTSFRDLDSAFNQCGAH